jgi:hypothetical protein
LRTPHAAPPSTVTVTSYQFLLGRSPEKSTAVPVKSQVTSAAPLFSMLPPVGFHV